MTDECKLMELRKILESGEDDSDDILLSYLAMARDELMNRLYPYSSERHADMVMPERYDMKQIRVAAYLLNRRGAEGEVQHIENGIHRNYQNADIPQDMLWDVFPLIGIPR